MGNNLILAGFSVTITVGVLTFLRMFHLKRLDFIIIFLSALLFFHGILLMFSIALPSNNNIDWLQKLISYDSYAWLYFSIVLIFAIGVSIGGILSYKSIAFYKKASFSDMLNSKHALKLLIVGWLLLSISVFSYWLYSRAYGGFISLYHNAFLIKSGFFYISPEENSLSFLGKLGGLSFVASFVFWGILIALPKQRTRLFFITTIISFIISAIFSLYVIYTWFSRSHFISYVSTFIFSLIIRKYKLRPKTKIFVVILIIFFTLFFLSSYITKGVKLGEDEINRLAMDTSVRIIPMFVFLENPEYRWFQDLVYIPLYFLPKKVWRSKLIRYTASDIITIKMMGAPKGEAGVKGAMVIGAVPFSYLQGGVIGVAILGLLWGVFLVLIERWLLFKFPPGIGETLYSYMSFRLVISSVWGADPQNLIYNNLDILIGLTFIAISKLKVTNTMKFRS